MKKLVSTPTLAPSIRTFQPWRFANLAERNRRASIRESFKTANTDALANYSSERAKLYAVLKLNGLDRPLVQLAIFSDVIGPRAKLAGRTQVTGLFGSWGYPNHVVSGADAGHWRRLGFDSGPSQRGPNLGSATTQQFIAYFYLRYPKRRINGAITGAPWMAEPSGCLQVYYQDGTTASGYSGRLSSTGLPPRSLIICTISSQAALTTSRSGCRTMRLVPGLPSFQKG